VDVTERGAQFLIAFWHQVIQDLQLADYSRTKDGVEVNAPQTPGPTYAARALGIAHITMYDAYVGVTAEAATYLKYAPADLPVGIPGAPLSLLPSLPKLIVGNNSCYISFQSCFCDSTQRGRKVAPLQNPRPFDALIWCHS
jgi:hypothetical protein